MLRSFMRLLPLFLLAWLFSLTVQAAPFEDSMAQRTQACTVCHGKDGRAGPDGYYPRLAGKPAGYLYNQLLNFRDGRRHYGLMAGLVAPLSDAYLLEIAQYFSALDVSYPAPVASTASAQVLERGRTLALNGDARQKLPACTSCHGAALTGAAPHVPGLLGLPRDYLNAQLGAWQTRQRQAMAPDCMAHIAGQLSSNDVSALAHWLSSQAVPAKSKPLAVMPPDSPALRCGKASWPVPTRASGSATLPAGATTAAVSPAVITQGAYLARVGNCMSCHTAQGGAPYAGGRGIDTPFGTVYAGNLTPDVNTGLGRWSADDFWRAMHEGRSRDGHLLYPAFPYTNFTQMSRTDADALFGFLKTLAPVSQANTPHTLRWPYSTQTALAVWRTLYFKPGTVQADSSRSAEWNRGAYLVRGLGHCSACHTPRNALGASQNSAELGGSMMPLQNWYAPSLRNPQEAGLSEANQAHRLALLAGGVSVQGAVTGPMAEVVQNSTQHWSRQDLNAMAVFLKSVASSPSPAPPSVAQSARPSTPASSTAATNQGAKLYDKHCVQCHGAQGAGVGQAYPALAGNSAVTLSNTANLVQTVLYGGFAPATRDNPRPFGMPPYVLELKDQDTAALLSFIRQAWGNQAPAVTELEVHRARNLRP
jgi:cytochrome c553